MPELNTDYKNPARVTADDGDLMFAEAQEIMADAPGRVTFRDLCADNFARAGFAFDSVTEYAHLTGQHNDEVQAAMSDLINDLRHLADVFAFDWDQLTRLDDYIEDTVGDEVRAADADGVIR